MVYNLKSTINKLEEQEKENKKKGYNDDATEKAFRRHCLLLLKDIGKQLKENSKQYKYLWESLECSGIKI